MEDKVPPYRIASLLFIAFWVFFPSLSYADYTFESNASTGGVYDWGDTVNLRIAEEFTTTGAGGVTRIDFCFYSSSGTNTDDIQVDVYEDVGGEPSGSSIADGVINSTGINNTHQRHTFTVSGSVLDAATTYWVVVSRLGSQSGTNFFSSCGAGSGGTAAYDNGAWNVGSGSHSMEVFIDEDAEDPPPEEPDTGFATTSFMQVPVDFMHFDTFISVFYVLSLAMGGYFGLSVIRFFTG